jgi:NAD-dependent DNA ligase
MKQIIKEIMSLGAKEWALRNPKKIKLIKKLMVQCATAYYEGSALITDAEFECFVDVLKCVKPNDKLLCQPGWGYKVKRGSKHLYGKVGSLPYFFNYDDLVKYLNGLQDFVVAPKFDGINFVAYYHKGKLKKCLTRGNGYVGKNITWAFKSFDLCDELKNKTFAINGEVILNENVNMALNFRDEVAEYLNRNNSKKLSFEFVPFGFLNTSNNNYVEVVSQINKISNLKLQTKRFEKLPESKVLKQIYDELSAQFKIDGLVITDVNMNKQVAYKFK